ARAVSPGSYYVVASASAPTAVSLLLELDEPSPAPTSDACETAPLLSAEQSVSVPLGQHTELIDAGCLPGAVDAAFEFTLAETSDVLLLQRFSAVDETAVALVRSGCSPGDSLVCDSSATSPLRVVAPAVPPGTYRIVTESLLGNNVELAAFTRPAVGKALVPFSDGCDGALEVSELGGHYYGNTATARATLSASCDSAWSDPLGAPD